MSDSILLKGSFRLAIANPDGEIVGDSGWVANQITDEGYRDFCRLMGAISGSSAISHVAIGTGTAPGAAATSLDGEQSVRASLTNATSAGSKALLCVATFSSGASFVTAQKNIANLGLFPVVTANTGTLLAGNTFTSSTCATNQDVYVSYSLTFS